jgi:hypothetical protein
MSVDAVGKCAVAANHLAPIRAFCASSGPSTRPKTRSVRKIFCAAKSGARASLCAKRFAGSDRNRIAFCRYDKNCDNAKTLDSSAFLHGVAFGAKKCARGKISAAALRLHGGRASSANGGSGSYTQNLVE